MKKYNFDILEENILNFDPNYFSFAQKIQLLKAFNEGIMLEDLNLLAKEFGTGTRSVDELKETIQILKLYPPENLKKEILNKCLSLGELREIKKMIKRGISKKKITESIQIGYDANSLYKTRHFYEAVNGKNKKNKFKR